MAGFILRSSGGGGSGNITALNPVNLPVLATEGALRSTAEGAIVLDVNGYLSPGGSGAELTGITKAQIDGLHDDQIPQFRNVKIAPSGLTYGTPCEINFADNGNKILTPSGDVEFSTVNLSDGVSVTILIVGGGSDYALAFPAGWKFVCEVPTVLSAGKIAELAVQSYGTTDAQVVAGFAVQP